MAEFSKEYCDLNPEFGKGDFSIMEIFNTLEDGYMQVTICEGFGIGAVGNMKGTCYVMKKGWEDFEKFVENFQN